MYLFIVTERWVSSLSNVTTISIKSDIIWHFYLNVYKKVTNYQFGFEPIEAEEIKKCTLLQKHHYKYKTAKAGS